MPDKNDELITKDETVTKDYIRKSLFVKKELDKAIKLMAVLEEKAEYAILNEALEKYIPEKYIKMAQKK